MPENKVRRYYGLIWFSLIVTVCFGIYFPGLEGPFFLDDIPHLTPLFAVDSGTNEWAAWDYLFSRSGYLGRPVSMATFIFNAIEYGDDTWFWKLWNLVIHGMTGIAIFFFTSRILKHVNEAKEAIPLSLLVTAFWLLHPLHVSTVLYTVQRMTQLSTLFIFLGLLFYVTGRQRLETNKLLAGWTSIGATFLLFFPLAIFSKETGLLLPVLVFIVELFVFRFNIIPTQKKYLTVLFISFLWIPLVAGLVYISINYDNGIMQGYVSREFTLTERLLTEFRVIVFYLYQLLFPAPFNMGFFHDDIEISKSLFDPLTTLFSFITIMGLLLFSWIKRKDFPLITFGIVFFFVSHSLESTIFPLELAFEHRNYLASYGIILLFSVLIYPLFNRKQRIIQSIPVFLLISCSLLLAFRVQAWGSENSMYLYMQKQRPDSKRLTTIVANIYADNGHYDKANELLGRFDEIGFKVNSLYIKCRRDGALQTSDFENISVDSGTIVNLYAGEAIINLANLGLDNACGFRSSDFIALVDKALSVRTHDNLVRQNLFMYKAHYFHREKNYPAAINVLERAFSTYDRNPVPLFLASEWYIDRLEISAAKKYYNRAVIISGKSGKDYSALIAQVGARISEKVSQ